jgi:periplasmic protein CpxP/Spy
MKKIILIALLAVGLTAFAQDKKEKMTTDQKATLASKKMKLELELNDKQTGDIKKIFKQQIEKREANKVEMEARKDERKRPTPDEIFEMKSKMLDNQMAMKAEIKKILTPVQFTKWEEIKEDRHEEIQEKRKERIHNRKREFRRR